MVRRQASDLHLKVGRRRSLRIFGELVELNFPVSGRRTRSAAPSSC
jgi:Tfp pilus assembly pilus retraction ATPase PilT